MTAGRTGYARLDDDRTARDPITGTLHPERLATAPTPAALTTAPPTTTTPTTTTPATTTPAPARHRHRSAGGRRAGLRVPWTGPGFPAERVVFLVGAVLLAVVSVALRAWHQTSAYDVFVDEIEYADVGNSFAAGVGPRLFDQPFFLHPSLPFALLGAAIGHPVSHMTVDFVLGLRPLLLPFAAANTLLVVGIARRVVGPWAALLAGVVYALDPFVVRFDSRVMLEAPMMTGILGGVLAALVAVDRPASRARRGWLAVAGVAFGLAVCTKSTSALITAVPLVLMAVTSWGLRRREALETLAIQCSVYLVYLVWVVATGNLPNWFDQTLAGTFRAVGLIKQTGFTSANAPSFAGRLIAQIPLFGPSYLLIGTAVCYACYLLLIGWRSLRVDGPGGSHALRGDGDDLGLLTCWLAGVLVALVYTAGLGEIEEQTFYLLAVPSTVVVALLVTQMASWRRLGRTVLAAVLTLGLTASAAVWWTVHSQPDDSYRRLADYIYSHIDIRNEVALGEETAQFVLPGYGLHLLTSVDDARRTSSRYALVSTELTAQGLAPAKQPLVDELARRYRLVFSAHGRTAGDLRLYDLDQPLDGSPPVAPGPPR